MSSASSEDKDWPKRKYANEHERKIHKPILEKKRRARINKSLDQLKSLLLETVKGDGGHYSKLEKADILEMTVRHLKDLQTHQLNVAMVMDPSVVQRYESGFSECAHEVNRYMATIDGIDHVTKSRLLDHLSNCRNNRNNIAVPQPQPPTGLIQPIVGQLTTIQPYSIVGPISPPIYGSIFESSNQTLQHQQSSQRSDKNVQSSSIMYSSMTPVLKKKPEATVTRQSLSGGLTRGLSDSTNTHLMHNSHQQISSISSKTNVLNNYDKENMTSSDSVTNNKSVQRHFTGQSVSQNDSNTRQNSNISHSNVNIVPFGNNSQNINSRNEHIFNQSVAIKEEPMWRPW